MSNFAYELGHQTVAPANVRFNDDDAMLTFERVWKELIARIKGDTWKLTDKVLKEL